MPDRLGSSRPDTRCQAYCADAFPRSDNAVSLRSHGGLRCVRCSVARRSWISEGSEGARCSSAGACNTALSAAWLSPAGAGDPWALRTGVAAGVPFSEDRLPRGRLDLTAPRLPGYSTATQQQLLLTHSFSSSKSGQSGFVFVSFRAAGATTSSWPLRRSPGPTIDVRHTTPGGARAYILGTARSLPVPAASRNRPANVPQTSQPSTTCAAGYGQRHMAQTLTSVCRGACASRMDAPSRDYGMIFGNKKRQRVAGAAFWRD